MKLKIILVVLFFILILPTTGVGAEDYTIDGDVVYIDNSNVYMSATPHTIASSGWVYFNLTSKQYSGDIDVVWGFNTSVSKPTKAEVYAPHWINTTTENEYTFYNVSDFSLYTGDDFDYGNSYNDLQYEVTHEVAIWNYDTDEIEGYETVTSTVGFDTQVPDGNDRTAYWHTRNDKYVLWKDKTSTFTSVTHDYQGYNKWYYIKNVNVNAGQEYTLRAWIDIPVSLEPQSGKYYYATKPSGETIPEAIASGHFYALDPWWNSSWTYYKSIGLNQSMIDQDIGAGSFPMLVFITDSDLADHAQIDGDDIVFTNSANNTQLPHEIEFWNSTTGVLVAWVNVTDITNVSSINMYYNNSDATDTQDPEGVWDANFVLVQHLSETPPGTTVDSTSHSNDGTTTGMDSADQISGQIDGSLDFEGLAAFIQVDDGDALDFEASDESFTVSFWTIPTVTDYYQAFMMKGDANNDFWRVVLKNTGYVGASADSIDFNSASTLTAGTLYHITAVFDKDGNGQIYLNGSPDGTPVALNNEVFAIATQYTRIGDASYTPTTEQRYDGMLDETRISNIPRSAAWIITDFNTSAYPTLFISVGVEQSDVPDGVKYYSNTSETVVFTDTIYMNKIVAGVNYSFDSLETITVTDGIEMSKTVAAVNYSIDNSETITIVDGIEMIKTVASINYSFDSLETITVTDGIEMSKTVASINYTSDMTETITITDEIEMSKTVASINYSIDNSDTIIIVDEIEMIKTVASINYSIDNSDTITYTDVVEMTKTSAGVNYSIDVSDAVTYTDGIEMSKTLAVVNYSFDVNDTIAYTDTVSLEKTTASVNNSIDASETISVSDSIEMTKTVASINYSINNAETITYTDVVAVTKTIGSINYSIDNTESIVYADTISMTKTSASVDYSIDNTESIVYADTVSMTRTIASVEISDDLSDTITISDSVWLSKSESGSFHSIRVSEYIFFLDNTNLAETNLDNFTFSNENVDPTRVSENNPFTVSIDISDSDGTINTAIVKINDVNYTMTSGVGDAWSYVFTDTSTPARYELDMFYARDNSGAWNSTPGTLYVDVFRSSTSGGGSNRRPVVTPTATPEITEEPVEDIEDINVTGITNVTDAIKQLMSTLNVSELNNVTISIEQYISGINVTNPFEGFFSGINITNPFEGLFSGINASEMTNITESVERFDSYEVIRVFKFNFDLYPQSYGKIIYIEKVDDCRITSNMTTGCDVEGNLVTITFNYEPDRMIDIHSDSVTVYRGETSQNIEIDTYVFNFTNWVWWMILIILLGMVILVYDHRGM